MSEILVLVPIKPNLHPDLKRRCRELAEALPTNNPDHRLTFVLDESGIGDHAVRTLEERIAHTAPIRQAMVDKHLSGRDYVLWADADVVSYPADLPSTLIRRNPAGVSAPIVLLEGHDSRFYDIAGFVEGGRWANLYPPYFSQPGPVYELDGVGCVYLVAAEVYRSGARYEPVPGYTEHFAVCRHARSMGLPVRAYADLVAYHADLTRYGEAYH